MFAVPAEKKSFESAHIILDLPEGSATPTSLSHARLKACHLTGEQLYVTLLLR